MLFTKYIDAVEQAAKKVQRAREKAVKQEYKTDQTLSNAQHKHDRAIADKNKAEHDRWPLFGMFPRCIRSIFKRSIEPLRVGVQSLSELSARKTLEM